MALNFKSLLTRTLTAAVFVAVLLSCICWNYISFSVLFLIVSVLGLHEFYKISELLGAKPNRIIGLTIVIATYLIVFTQNAIYNGQPHSLVVFGLTDSIFNLMMLVEVIGFTALIFIGAIFSKNEKPITDIGYTILGIAYCGVPFLILNKIVFPTPIISFGELIYNPSVLLGMILLIWASDSFAYLVGSMIGKRKLYERISPGKTWEGTIGGGVLTMASSYLVAGWFPEIEFKHWLVISLLVVVFGTLGDLFESLLKRQAGIKDSGKIMPGHGGILDRFDSLMFVTPFVYLYLSWVYL